VAIRFVIGTDEILFKSSFSAKLIKNSTPRSKYRVMSCGHNPKAC
jgi:hypothetical protein